MEDQTKKKLYAAARITYGVARGASALLLATGHGLLAAFMKKHHMMNQAGQIARLGMRAAAKTIEEGMKDWDRAYIVYYRSPDDGSRLGLRLIWLASAVGASAGLQTEGPIPLLRDPGGPTASVRRLRENRLTVRQGYFF
jgi:hypothetical protein